MNYDNTYDYGLMLVNTLHSWNSDSYTNWLSQNAVNIGLVGVAGGTLALGQAGMGNVIGAGATLLSVSKVLFISSLSSIIYAKPS